MSSHADITRSTDERLRCTKIPVPRGASYLYVKRHDLYMPDEKEQYSKYPNYDNCLASIKVPSLAYWSRMFLGNYDELYIVSPESSPNSSVADSDSRRISPSSTWSQEDSQEDTRLDAAKDNSGVA